MAITAGELDRPCPNCSDVEKVAYGCETETKQREHWIRLGDIEINRCPYKMVKRYHYRIVQAASLLEAHILPDPGGWLDQAAAFCKAALIVCAATREAEKKE